MVTGQPAFTGKSQTSLDRLDPRSDDAAADLEASTFRRRSALEPVDRDVSRQGPGRPLAERPHDLATELKWIVEAASRSRADGTLGPSRCVAPRQHRARAVPAAIVAAAASAAIVSTLKPAAPGVEATLARVRSRCRSAITIGDRVLPSVVASADGSTLAYVGRRAGAVQLFFRPIGTLETRAVPGTEGAASPFFSPDGEWIGFVAQGKLKKVPTVGGAVETLCDAAIGMGATWAPGDTIYFSPFSTAGLWKVSALGGAPEPAHGRGPEQGRVQPPLAADPARGQSAAPDGMERPRLGRAASAGVEAGHRRAPVLWYRVRARAVTLRRGICSMPEPMR